MAPPAPRPDAAARLATATLPRPVGGLLRLGRGLVDGAGALWARAGGPLPRLDPAALLRGAARDVGGGRPAALPREEGLALACASIEDEGQLGLIGRLMLRKMLRRSLANQLRFAAARRAGPAPALAQPPIFIVGLPRSGTTFLHRLVCALPTTWGIPLWQAQQPFPPAGPDRRRLRFALDLRAMRSLDPSLDRKHAFELDAPEEAITLFDAAGGWNPSWWRFADGSRYLRWLLAQDPAPGCAAFADQVRRVAAGRPGRLVLKTPNHMGALSALHDAFPGAVFVQTHRDPAVCLPSYLSLHATMHGLLSRAPDPHRLGRSSLHLWSTHARRALADRAARPELRVLDVDYGALTADPVAVLARVCDHAGLPFDPPARARATAELAHRRQHRHGRHVYALADWGLDRAQVHAAFAGYLAAHLPALAPGGDPCASA